MISEIHAQEEGKAAMLANTHTHTHIYMTCVSARNAVFIQQDGCYFADCNGVSTPMAMSEKVNKEEEQPEMSLGGASGFCRGAAARLNYLAQDRPGIGLEIRRS